MIDAVAVVQQLKLDFRVNQCVADNGENMMLFGVNSIHGSNSYLLPVMMDIYNLHWHL